MQILETTCRSDVNDTVAQIWYATLRHPKMHPHTNFRIPTSNNVRDILKTRSDVKVIVTPKWYVTLCHPKMHSCTKFGIPSSKNIGDMHQTQCGF